MGFVSIDNRPDFFIDLNSTYLNDTLLYNLTNTSTNSFDVKDETGNTIEFVLMSLVTVLLGILILITIIGKKTNTIKCFNLIDFGSFSLQETSLLSSPS